MALICQETRRMMINGNRDKAEEQIKIAEALGLL